MGVWDSICVQACNLEQDEAAPVMDKAVRRARAPQAVAAGARGAGWRAVEGLEGAGCEPGGRAVRLDHAVEGMKLHPGRCPAKRKVWA